MALNLFFPYILIIFNFVAFLLCWETLHILSYRQLLLYIFYLYYKLRVVTIPPSYLFTADACKVPQAIYTYIQ